MPWTFSPEMRSMARGSTYLGTPQSREEERESWMALQEVFQGKGRLRVQNSGPPYRTSRHNGPGTVYMLGVPTLLLFLSGSVRKATWLLPFERNYRCPIHPKTYQERNMNGSCWTVQELRYYRYSLELK